jgi:hypothetical protein
LQQIKKLFWQLGAYKTKLVVIGAWIFGMRVACESSEQQNLAQQHEKGVATRLESLELCICQLYSICHIGCLEGYHLGVMGLLPQTRAVDVELKQMLLLVLMP